MCVGALEGASGAPALRCVAPPHGPSTGFTSGRRHIQPGRCTIAPIFHLTYNRRVFLIEQWTPSASMRSYLVKRCDE